MPSPKIAQPWASLLSLVSMATMVSFGMGLGVGLIIIWHIPQATTHPKSGHFDRVWLLTVPLGPSMPHGHMPSPKIAQPWPSLLPLMSMATMVSFGMGLGVGLIILWHIPEAATHPKSGHFDRDWLYPCGHPSLMGTCQVQRLLSHGL